MNRRGFTLIELILSVSLVSVILLVAVSSLSFGSRLWESGYRMADHGWIKRYFQAGFRSDVSSAYPYPTEDGVLFKGTPGRLVFVSANGAVAGLPWGGARLVEYAVEDGRLVMKEEALPSAEVGHARTLEISSDIETIRFSFLGSSGWEDEWDGIAKNALPRAVKAAVTIKDRKDSFEFSMPVMSRGEG